MSVAAAPHTDLDQVTVAQRNDPVTCAVAIATLFLAGLNLKLTRGVPLAFGLIACLGPLWWFAIVRFEFVRAILTLAAASVLSGLALAEHASTDYAISALVRQQSLIELFGGLTVFVAVLWGRALFPLHTVALIYGSGDLLNAILFSPRSWKYNLAVPTAIIIVGWLGRYRNRSTAVIALLSLGVIVALDRGRSFFAFCVLAACMTVWQYIPTSSSGAARRWRPAIVMAVAGVALYDLIIGLLTRGYLGYAAQQRTIEQIETSGSLLLGGRPQWAATFALMADRPLGYGLGVVPTTHEYAIVTSSFQSLNLQEDGYIRNFMLGGQFKLHSITADLWVRYGIAGLLLAGVAGFALVRTGSTLLAQRRCPPLVCLMTVLGLWYLVFESTWTYTNDVFFALGVTLIPRGSKQMWRAAQVSTTAGAPGATGVGKPLNHRRRA